MDALEHKNNFETGQVEVTRGENFGQRGAAKEVPSFSQMKKYITPNEGEGIDRDMLIAGGLFHDIGKLWELDYETAIGYSDQGRLVPHLIIGVQLIDRLTAKIEKFSEEKKLLLQHIVLAHHGSREFGSPVLPATAEAVIIHYIDDMDAKVWSYQTQVEKAPPDALWSDRHNLLGTAVRRTSAVKKAIYDYRLPGESADAPAAETGPAFPVKEPQRKSAKAAEAGQIDLLKK